MAFPFLGLEYLYVGCKDFVRDLAYYRDVLGAHVVWNHEGFGAHVAGLRLGKGPLILLADHRPAPSTIVLYEVADVKETAKVLRKRGWKSDGRSFEIPNGPCYVFDDPSGNRYGFFENVRPHVFETDDG
jgi:catechol 2,3-dioxygenase-like lactoylglutathione lyase family enzyme